MWQLDGSKARLETSPLSCQLDLASPASGLTELMARFESKRAATAIDGALMQLMLVGQETLLTDAYVRGNDLVATYSESADRPYRTQVYWRFERDSEFVGIQLIVSVQTSRLEADPSLTVVSRLPGSAWLVEQGAVVVRLIESGVCYAEFTDESNIESTIVGDAQVTHALFPGSLEKGVIRRARMIGCFLPAVCAERTARTLHERFVRSAPPLTT